MKGEVKTRRSRYAEVIQKALQLCRMVTSHPRCANQLEEPDRHNEGPLHIENLLRPDSRGVVLDPKVNPHGKVGVITDREVPLERREKFARSLHRLPRRCAGRVGRIRCKL